MTKHISLDELRQRRGEDQRVTAQFDKVEQWQKRVIGLIMIAIGGLIAVLGSLFQLYFVIAEFARKM